MTPQRALIDAAEKMRNELTGIIGSCETDMRYIMGNTNVSVLQEKLQLLETAISSAKAAEEGVVEKIETEWQVWVRSPHKHGANWETHFPSLDKAQDYKDKFVGGESTVSIFRFETRRFEVREKEGL